MDLSTTHFALDVQELPEVIYTSEGNLYLHLPGVIMAESATGEVRYLLSDGLGSVRQATDESGEVVAYNEFDPYGNPVQDDSRPYGFTGEWWESDIGLLHLRARWYQPETGTFVSRDPWAGHEFWPQSMNGWNYVEDNPTNYGDPSGLCRPLPGIDCEEWVQTKDGSYLHLKATVIEDGSCSSDPSSCNIIPSTQYPTIQPAIDIANQGGTAVIYPLSLAGATTKFVEQGGELSGMIRYSWNLPPEIILSSRGTIRLQPAKLAGYSTLVSAAIPAGVGVLNAGEIQLRTVAGELTPSQSRQQHIVNAAATGVGVGGAWFIPAGANATAIAIGVTPAPGAVGLTAASTSVASVAVPATIAAFGGFCLAYDISIIQGTTNKMIEGQSLWPAYIDAREETHQTMLFGYDPLR